MSMRIVENKNVNVDLFYTELEKQFPQKEIKSKETFKQIILNQKYKVFNIINNNLFSGYFSFFEFDDNTILIDYFAINKEFHSLGLGSKTFGLIKQELNYLGCYLEVEKKNQQDINTFRRAAFYEKLGAKKLDINYLYPHADGFLPMDLYFMPLKNNYTPSQKEVLKNIKTAFDNIHFDLEHSDKIYEGIK